MKDKLTYIPPDLQEVLVSGNDKILQASVKDSFIENFRFYDLNEEDY